MQLEHAGSISLVSQRVKWIRLFYKPTVLCSDNITSHLEAEDKLQKRSGGLTGRSNTTGSARYSATGARLSISEHG